MTTASPPRPKPAKSVLKELSTREAEITRLADEATDLGRQTKAASDHFQSLHDERRRLAIREPGLFTHTGEPNPEVKDNPVAEVDKALAICPDVNDLAQRYDHAKKLQARAEQGLADWLAARTADLIDALAPEADAAHAEAETKLAEAEAAVTSYLHFIQRWEQLTKQRSLALDGAADIARTLKAVGVSPIGPS